MICIALVLIFILYLVDKHNRWREAVKVTIGIAILGAVVVAALFGWAKYDNWRAIRDARKAQQAHGKLVDACVARYSKSGYRDPFADLGGATLVRETCEGNPDYDWSRTSFDPNKPYNNLVEIHGGETLKIKPPSGLDSKSILMVYLGHHQKIALVCGIFGETTPLTIPRIENGAAVCD